MTIKILGSYEQQTTREVRCSGCGTLLRFSNGDQKIMPIPNGTRSGGWASFIPCPRCSHSQRT
jgi:DNA-directed RNA polymerase subunit RPC12/RpoP